MKVYNIVFGVPVAQQQSAANVITAPRPLEDAALRLQEMYGKVVTYEEPLLWQETR